MAEEQKPVAMHTHVVQTGDGEVHITQPKGQKHRHVTVLLDGDDIKDQVGGFTNFLKEYAVVGLAIGFIIGQQTNAVMNQLVSSFISPWIQVIFGKDLATRSATLHHGSVPIPLPWGAFVYAFIQFVFVVIVIYLAFRLLRLDKLKKK
ncbi:MAG: MscL family protein [Candidatus Saccharibacteria bacterium]